MAARKRHVARKLAATLFTTLLAPFLVNTAVRLFDPATFASIAVEQPASQSIATADSEAPKQGAIGRMVAGAVRQVTSNEKDARRHVGWGGDRR